MAKNKQLPAGDDFRTQWTSLDRAGRRRVRRAANRARPASNRKEAGLAAAMAVNQQRMWRWAWIVAPVVLALLRIPDGWAAVLANLAAALAVFGLMALYFRRRASKAEAINYEVFTGQRPPQAG